MMTFSFKIKAFLTFCSLLTCHVSSSSSSSEMLIKRSSGSQSILDSERYAPNIDEYEVTLPKYESRYSHKESQGVERARLDRIQYKIDMLHRKSADEITSHAEKQKAKMHEIHDKWMDIRKKYASARFKERAFQLLRDGLKSGRKVSDEQLYKVYGKILRDAQPATSSSSTSLRSTITGFISRLIGEEKAMNDKTEDDTQFQDLLMQHRAAVLTTWHPTLYDVARSRKKIEKINKELANGLAMNDKHQRDLEKATLLQKTVLEQDSDSADELAQMYAQSAIRLEKEKDRLEGWYHFMQNKSQIWEDKASEFQIEDIPDLDNTSCHSPETFSDDDQ